jgi:hypothetical protein
VSETMPGHLRFNMSSSVRSFVAQDLVTDACDATHSMARETILAWVKAARPQGEVEPSPAVLIFTGRLLPASPYNQQAIVR